MEKKPPTSETSAMADTDASMIANGGEGQHETDIVRAVTALEESLRSQDPSVAYEDPRFELDVALENPGQYPYDHWGDNNTWW
jgi:hypothetical protein